MSYLRCPPFLGPIIHLSLNGIGQFEWQASTPYGFCAGPQATANPTSMHHAGEH